MSNDRNKVQEFLTVATGKTYGGSTVTSTLAKTSFQQLIEKNRKDKLDEYEKILKDQSKGQIIFYGPPGTGKTYIAKMLANKITNAPKIDEWLPSTHRKIVQFHPSYSYEDFVQGIKPVKNANGEVDYKLQPGIFQNLCNKAAEIPHDGNNHYFANVTDFQEISMTFTAERRSHGGGMNTVTKEEFEAILSTAFGGDVPEAFENIDNFKNFYRLNTKEDSKYGDIDGKIYHFDSSSLGYKKFLEDIQNNDVGIAYHDRKRGGFFGVGIILQSDYVEKTKSVLIIDEINRGNLSKIFGELIYGLEYRNEEIDLQYKEFDTTSPYGTLKIPPKDQLMVIGTMNTADRSIVLFDAALRRRFLFIPLFPDYDLLAQTFELDAEFDKTKLRVDFDNAKTSNDNKNKIISLLALEKINSALTNNPSIGREKQIGHTYLLDLQDDSRLFVKIWKMEILPLLEEYYFESPDELEKMFNKKLFETRDGIKEFDEKSLRDALYEYTKPPQSET